KPGHKQLIRIQTPASPAARTPRMPDLSLRTPLAIGWSRGLDNAHGTIGRNERLVRHPANVLLGYLVNPVDLIEELAPVTIKRNHRCQLLCQPFIVCQPPYEIRLCACLNHL